MKPIPLKSSPSKLKAVFFSILPASLLPFILTTLGYLAKLHYIIHYGEDVKPAIMQVTGKEYRPGRKATRPLDILPISNRSVIMPPIFQQPDIRIEI